MNRKTDKISRVSPAFAKGAMVAALGVAPVCKPQSLSWEGETGVFVTPLAYTAALGNGIGKPVVSFHYLNGGTVLGDGQAAGLSPLWHSGFNIVHGMIDLHPENLHKKSWIPAVSAGFVERSQVHNAGSALTNMGTKNGDVCAVASKTITSLKGQPIVLHSGNGGANAELWGLAGNAAHFTGRAFGAAAFVLKGPARGSITLGPEMAQQPLHPDGLPGAAILTTER
jgi:hypothetical protein